MRDRPDLVTRMLVAAAGQAVERSPAAWSRCDRTRERPVTGTAEPPCPGERHQAGVPGPSVRGLRYDPDADQTVAALYRAHYGSLTRIAAFLIGDSLAAEDMVQDAFASIYHAWRHLRDEESALDHLRGAVVSRARFLAAASPGRPGTPLLAAPRELPARQREALVLRYYADWPDLQIAAVMGISGRALNAHIRQGHPPSRPAPFRAGMALAERRDPGVVSADGRFRRTDRFGGRPATFD